MEVKLPVVGVQVAVFSKNAILLGKRKNVFGSGTWGLPGGHLEFGESFEGAASRELLEETGLKAVQLRTFSSINTPYEKTHYVQIGVEVLDYEGELENKEPEKCETLNFFKKDQLPSPLFPPSVDLIGQLFESRSDKSQRGTLCMYLSCIEPEKRKNRFANYILLESAQITLIAKFGSRNESKPRDTRVHEFSDYDKAFEFLKDEIAKRLRHGYSLYSCSGTLSLDKVFSLFPSYHPVALCSVPNTSGTNVMDSNIAALINQMPLFRKTK